MNPADSVLAGRSDDLAVLNQLVADVAAGRAGLAWIAGGPGIGKSTVLEQALATATAAGCRVLMAECDELLAPFPLRPAADALAIADPLAVPVLSALPPDGTAARMITAAEWLVGLVARHCADGPVVFAMDNLHWADEASLLVWSRLARLTSVLPLLLIGTARPVPDEARWPGGPDSRSGTLARLRELVAARGGVILEVAPLDAEAVAVLAGQLLGAPPGPRLTETLTMAGGNPRYLTRLAAALLADGVIVIDEHRAELAEAVDLQTVPPALATAIWDTLPEYEPPGVRAQDGSLSGRGLRAALRIAALLGREFDVGDWAAALGVTALEADALAAAGVGAEILSDTGDKLAFRHEIVWRALAERTPAALRGSTYGEIARMLADAGRAPVVVARLLLASTATGGPLAPWAAGWLAELPRSKVYEHPAVFIGLLKLAIDTLREESAQWWGLTIRSLVCLTFLRRSEEALAIAAAVAAQVSDPLIVVQARIVAIRAASKLGRLREVARLAGDCPELERVPKLWRARLAAIAAIARHLSSVGLTGLQSADDSAAGPAAESLELALACGDPFAITCALYAMAVCGNPAARLSRLRTALAEETLTDAASTEVRLAITVHYLFELARQGGGPEESAAALSAASALADRVGALQAAEVLVAMADLHCQQGSWDEALAVLDRVTDVTSVPGLARARQAITAEIALRRGERREATALLRAMEDSGAGARAGDGFGVTDTGAGAGAMARARSIAAETDRELADALSLALAVISEGMQGRHDDLVRAARLAVLADAPSTLADVVKAAEARVALSDGSAPGLDLTVRCCRALRDQDADGLLALAAEYRSLGWLPLAAGAAEEAAVLFGAAGRTDEARAALTEAARLLSGFGAVWEIRRADARVREFGVRRGPRSAHRRAISGWESLTPTEAYIARMVGQGMSNAEIAGELFLSTRTVHRHVSQILGKLGAASRIDLVREAGEKGHGVDCQPRPG